MKAGSGIDGVLRSLARIEAGSELGQRVELVTVGTSDRKTDARRLQHLTEFVQRPDFGQVERRHGPTLPIALHKPLGLEAHEGRTDGRPRRTETRLEATFAHTLTRGELKIQDGGSKPAVQTSVVHRLGSRSIRGALTEPRCVVYQYGIPTKQRAGVPRGERAE